MLSSTAMRLIKVLVGNRPQSVTQLMKAMGVTRTAVMEQLNELLSAGYVERGTERLPGRGRPRYLFGATEAALVLLFAANQRIVVPAIWSAIREIGSDKLVRDVTKRVTRTLANHYMGKITSTEPRQRLREFVEVLLAEGAMVEVVEENGDLVLYRRSCPFAALADEKRSVCAVDLDLMTAVVGRAVRRVGCRFAGDPCCSFSIVETNGK